LQVRLDEEMQRAFKRDESVGVTVGYRRVRADETACDLVERIARESTGRLDAE